MSNEKTTLEIIAPTVDEAVQKGLNELGLPADAVEVEVLDAGSKGLFGLGSRQSRVRLTIKEPAQPVAVKPAQTAAPVAEPEKQQPAAANPYAVDIEDPIKLDIARETVSELLDRMKVKAQVTAVMRPADEPGDEPVILVKIEGNDLSILIGRRSETLNALQYIASLIVCKKLDTWVPLMIDVQGYRERRERQLRILARRMAEQAVHTGRRQVLEPMPANERRLIHLELRDNTSVITESVGDEPNRKVTISVRS